MLKTQILLPGRKKMFLKWHLKLFFPNLVRLEKHISATPLCSLSSYWVKKFLSVSWTFSNWAFLFFTNWCLSVVYNLRPHKRQISACNINALTIQEVIRIKQMNLQDSRYSNNFFLSLSLRDRKGRSQYILIMRIKGPQARYEKSINMVLVSLLGRCTIHYFLFSLFLTATINIYIV